LDSRPLPLPRAGNQRSRTANRPISTIAATKEGMAAVSAVVTRELVSSSPGRSPARMPSPIPSSKMITVA